MLLFDLTEISLALAVSLLLWTIYGIIWRLCLSPIAAFPGPKLAALTFWYECYHDIVDGGGNYIWRIQEMHEKYGPIVRINPYELHIKDPEFYDQIYASAPHRRDKGEMWTRSPDSDNATGFTVEHDLHRLRREAIAPFFSKRNTTILEPDIKAKIEKFCCRLEEYADEKRSVNLTVACLAFTMDVLTQYSFAKSFDLMDEDDFNEKWRDTILSIVQALVVVRYFRWFTRLVALLPDRVAEWILPDVSQLRSWKLRIRNQVKEVLSYQGDYATNKEEKTTVFEELRDSKKLPLKEKSLSRLSDEGSILLIAGSETPGKVLALIYYYLLENPAQFQKLRDELSTVIPSTQPKDLPSQAQLERLPYLTAVISEGLRMHSGVAGRSQRVAPEPLRFHQWVIPACTPMSTSSIFIHYDENIYPNAHSFEPERWLLKVPANEGGYKFNHSLKKYLVAFGHGTRNCLGYNLGYSMLYLNIAAVVSRYDMELFVTGRDDVTFQRDWTIPMQRIGSVGIRATIAKRRWS